MDFPSPDSFRQTIRTKFPYRIIGDLCSSFQAFHAYIEDEDILALYRAERVHETTLANLPPELHSRVPPPMRPEDAAGSLPPVLLPQEFNLFLVPDAVWWINYWSADQVETVSRKKVIQTDWFRVVAQPNRALTLVATSEPTIVGERVHLMLLAKLINSLNLLELQQRFHV
jgi:hypothetical protein